MQSKLIALAAIAALAAPAPAIIVSTLDYFEGADAIADGLGLKLSLTEKALEEYWAGEVRDIGELAPIGTTVTDSDLFNKEMGEGADYAAGDVVILTPTENPDSWEADLYARGEGKWSNPDLNIIVSTLDYFDRLEKSGVDAAGPTPLALTEGALLVVTITNVEAFKAAWLGEGEVTQGQTAVMTPYADRVELGRFTVRDEFPVSAFRVEEGEIVKVK